MKDNLRTIAIKLESLFQDIYVELPTEALLPDCEGDIVIHVFNVPFEVEEEFLVAFDRLKKKILWPKDIYNVLFLPHTLEATQKYYEDRLPHGAIGLVADFWQSKVISSDLLKKPTSYYGEIIGSWWEENIASTKLQMKPSLELCDFALTVGQSLLQADIKWPSLFEPENLIQTDCDDAMSEQFGKAA